MAKRSKRPPKKLTDRREAFIKEYLISFNGADAARRAGYSKKTAREMAFYLLTNPHIVAEINRQMEKRMKKQDLSADFTLSRIRALAESNAQDVAQWADGTLILKDSAALTREQAYAIESLHMKQTLRGPEIKFKLRQPSSALEMLGRHQGLFDLGDQGGPSEELAEAQKQLDEEEGKP